MSIKTLSLILISNDKNSIILFEKNDGDLFTYPSIPNNIPDVALKRMTELSHPSLVCFKGLLEDFPKIKIVIDTGSNNISNMERVYLGYLKEDLPHNLKSTFGVPVEITQQNASTHVARIKPKIREFLARMKMFDYINVDIFEQQRSVNIQS